MKIGFFPGCSLEGSSREYNESLQAVAPLLGIELAEVRDWNCCGATAAHTLNPKLALALPARVLALAEQAGLDELVVPCSACYSRLAGARHELLHNEPLRQEIENIVELNCVGATKVLSVLDLFNRVTAKVKEQVRTPFAHKVACYYGCYLTRPKHVATCTRIEDPIEMEDIVRAAGAAPVRWAFKVECCGAGLSVSRTSSVAELSGRILDDAARCGAEAIVVACPMCHTNLDLRRHAIQTRWGVRTGRQYVMPVLYVSQVLGLALGLDPRRLGLHRHHVPVNLRPAATDSEKVIRWEGDKVIR
ncbi:MAG: CoB--CoM heterodisulfide reductase iron-sulfur subunit B family protein [Planctomycetota bacterium]